MPRCHQATIAATIVTKRADYHNLQFSIDIGYDILPFDISC